MTCNCICHKPGHSMKHAQPCCGDAGVTMAHTPGPWRQEIGTNLVWGACDPEDTTSYGMGFPVAEARIEMRKTYDWDQATANARLIAAAPELLEALREAHDTLHECTAVLTADDCRKVSAVMATARAALSKATGEGASA